MGKRLFLTFLLLIGASTTFVILYVQSTQFAQLLRNRFATQIESELGLVVDFDRLSIQAIPPGIAIVNPKIKEIKPGNALKIPTDSILQASEVGITFRMFQTLGSRLVVNRIYLKDAKIKFRLAQSSSNANPSIDAELIQLLSRPIHIRLASGLELDIRQVELKDSSIDLSFAREKQDDLLKIEKIKFFALRPERSLYSSVLDLENISWRFGDNSESILALRANLEVDPQNVRIISLDFTREEMNVHIGGQLTGDIRAPKKLKSSLRVIARATSAGLAQLIPDFAATKGIWSSELAIEGSVLAPAIKGKLSLVNFEYGLWSMDRVDAALEYTKNEIKLQQLKLTRKSGEITLEPCTIALGDGDLDQNLKFKFSNVNFHEFAGDLLHDVNNLEMILSGSIDASIHFSRNGKKLQFTAAQARPQLQVSHLELNNQVWGKQRKKKITIGVREIYLTGGFTFGGGKVKVENAKLKLPSGEVIANGIVDLKTGWDLVGESAAVDIGADIERIAEIPVEGTGPVKITVKGPASNIFLGFDLELDNAKYVNLSLGKLKGNITLDDKESKLILKGFHGTKHQGGYDVDGIIDVSGEDEITLRAKVVDMPPEDIFDIFKHQLRNMGWIPWSMNGKVNATASIAGKFTDPERTFDLRGHLLGQKLLYRGEILSSLEADFRLKDGLYSVDNVHAKKYNTVINGSLSYGVDETLQYRFALDRGRIRDIDYFTKMGIPVDAMISMSGWGKGKIAALKSHAELRMDNAHVGTFNMPTLLMRLDSNEDYIDFMSLFGDQKTRSRLRIARNEKKVSELELEASGGNFSFVFCLLNSNYCGDKIASVTLNSRLATTWRGSDWASMSGEMRLHEMRIESDDYDLKLSQPVVGSVHNGQLAFTEMKFLGSDTSLTVDANGMVAGSNFTTKLRGDLGLQSLTLATSMVQRASGIAHLDAVFRGSVSDLRLSGKVDVEHANLALRGISPGIEDMSGRIILGGSKARIDKLEGRWGQGKVAIDGSVDVFLNRAPIFALGMNLQDNRVKFVPLALVEIDRGRMTFTGEEPPYLFGGKVKIRKAIYRQNFDLKRKGQLRSAKYLPTVSLASFSLYTLKIDASGDGGILLQNDLLDAEFRGGVLLQNNFDFPRITGNADLIKGKLFSRGIPFELDHAVLKQTNPEEINPWFSLGGSANVSSYKITLFASGYADDPKISFGSSPPLPQEDILSLLAFGYIDKKDASIKPDDTNAVTYTEVGSILLDQLRLNKDLKSKGLNVRVTPIVIEREANIIHPRTVPESAVPKIEVQTQVVKNVDASLGTSVGSAQSQYFDMNMEYHLSNKFSVQSVYEQEPGVDPGETRRSVGGDLKFRWGFK